MKTIITALSLSLLFPQVPSHFNLSRDGQDLEGQSYSGLPSNSVVDIRVDDQNGIVYFGTSGGLAFTELPIGDNMEIRTFDLDQVTIPEGGNPGLTTSDGVVAVSGAIEAYANGDYHPAGSGVGYSVDGGLTWEYKSQYVEPPDSPLFVDFPWGGQTLSQLAVTTEINNISYDLAIIGDYIYTTSWAGGLRRFKFRNYLPFPEGEDPNPWEAVPLPMDDEQVQYCGYIDTESFVLNPNDPQNGGSHNHKGFSVYALEDTLWVGTAAGINKGIVYPNGCIDWRHYTADQDGFSGNWVISFTHQNLVNDADEDFIRLWVATWPTGGSETYALSYTDDGGQTWNIVRRIEELALKVYSVASYGDNVYASTDGGLYFSDNGLNWERFSRPVSDGGTQILTETIYASAYIPGEMMLLAGTPDGIAATTDMGESWNIHRFWIPAVSGEGDDDLFYAYPNPFYNNDVNVVEGDGHVRFVGYLSSMSTAKNELHIFDFSMAAVKSFGAEAFHTAGDDQVELIWNGRNDWGDPVANGVYFCRWTKGDSQYWTKLLVIN